MKKRFDKPLLIVLLITIIFSGFSSAFAQSEYRVGVLSFRNQEITRQQWQPTVDYLNQTIPEYKFELVPFYIKDFVQHNEKKKFDFILTNPEHFILYRSKLGLNAIATLMPIVCGRVASEFGGVIFTRSDSKNIKHINHVRYASISAAEKQSFAGYLAQVWLLSKLGISLDDLNITFTGMPQDKVVENVLSKKTDVGFVRTGVLESMIKEGKLSLEDIKVINQKQITGFDMLLSTDLYPEWPFAVSNGVSNEASKKVAKALLNIDSNSSAALHANYYGFSPPKDYTAVDAIMQRLRIHPDREINIEISDIIDQYSTYLFLISLFCFVVVLWVLFLLMSDKKNLAKKIRENEMLLASIGEGLYGVDLKGNCTFINQVALDMLQIKSEDILGKNQHEIFHHHHENGDEYKLEDCPIHHTVIDGKSRFVNEIFFRTNGTMFNVRLIISPVFDDGVVVGAMVAFQDITEKLEQDRIIKSKQEEFETIYNISKDGMAVLDLETKFLDFNDAYLEMTGFTRDELLSKTCLELTAQEDVESTKNAMQTVFKQGFIRDFEKACIVKNDKKIVTSMAISLLPDKNRLFISTKDITEKNNLENRLRQTNENLQNLVMTETEKRLANERLLIQQSKLAMMGEMISNIAHQWRQPLNALAIKVQDVPMSIRFNEFNIEGADKFKNDSMTLIRYMSDTIEDFRNFFKPEKTKESFDIREFVNKAVTLAKDSFKSSFISINVSYPDKEILFHGYPNEFAQVVLNILNNSRDALKLIDSNDKFVEIKVVEEGDSVFIYISDNGGGIPEEIIDRIFEPYFTTKHQSQGTGLGLYMSKMIIEQNMEGSISVVNSSIGAVFTLELSLAS